MGEMKVYIGESQAEVGCTVHGRPSYKWVPAWAIVDEAGLDIVQAYVTTKRQAEADAKEVGEYQGEWQARKAGDL